MARSYNRTLVRGGSLVTGTVPGARRLAEMAALREKMSESDDRPRGEPEPCRADMSEALPRATRKGLFTLMKQQYV